MLDPDLTDGVDLDDVDRVLGSAENAADAAARLSGNSPQARTAKKGIGTARGALQVAKTATGIGAGVASASGLTVAATSGAGITSGLAAAGGVVGGGMAAAPAVLAAGPTYLATEVLNRTVFRPEAGIDVDEADARGAARVATRVGGVAGIAGASLATVAGGASGPAIMATLGAIGGTVGGGAIVGTALLVAAPAVAATAAGFGVYKVLRWSKRRK